MSTVIKQQQKNLKTINCSQNGRYKYFYSIRYEFYELQNLDFIIGCTNQHCLNVPECDVNLSHNNDDNKTLRIPLLQEDSQRFQAKAAPSFEAAFLHALFKYVHNAIICAFLLSLTFFQQFSFSTRTSPST